MKVINRLKAKWKEEIKLVTEWKEEDEKMGFFEMWQVVRICRKLIKLLGVDVEELKKEII